MIGALAADHELLLGQPADIVGELHEAQRGLHRRRAAGGEEDVIEIARCVRREPGGEFRRWLVHRVPRRVVGKRHRLVAHDVGEFGPAMADIHAPHARRSVDEPPAVRIADVDAVTVAHQAAGFGADMARHRPWLDQVAFGLRHRAPCVRDMFRQRSHSSTPGLSIMLLLHHVADKQSIIVAS